MLRALVSVCLFAVLASTSSPANAQTSDNLTYFTFSQPVTLLDVTFPLASWLGALSMVAGALSQKGPDLRM